MEWMEPKLRKLNATGSELQGNSLCDLLYVEACEDVLTLTWDDIEIIKQPCPGPPNIKTCVEG